MLSSVPQHVFMVKYNVRKITWYLSYLELWPFASHAYVSRKEQNISFWTVLVFFFSFTKESHHYRRLRWLAVLGLGSFLFTVGGTGWCLVFWINDANMIWEWPFRSNLSCGIMWQHDLYFDTQYTWKRKWFTVSSKFYESGYRAWRDSLLKILKIIISFKTQKFFNFLNFIYLIALEYFSWKSFSQ